MKSSLFTHKIGDRVYLDYRYAEDSLESRPLFFPVVGCVQNPTAGMVYERKHWESYAPVSRLA